MQTPAQVVVVGSFNQDLTWHCVEFPAPGETTVGTFTSGPGGKGANQAVAAARAGVPTAFVGALGDDAFGDAARAFLHREGISVHAARKRQPTGNAAILVNRHGQNQIVVALGANAALTPRDVPATRLRGARVVVCQHETTLSINAHVFRLARRCGVTTVLNPAPMRDDFDPAILRLADVLIPNETELVALANRLKLPGKTTLTESKLARLAPAALHRLCRSFGVPTVIVTLGRRGCFVAQASGHAALPACAGLKVVDTTGAGDAFCGGFAAGLVKHHGDTLAAARFGTVVAGLSVTKPGAAPAMPSAREVARFLRRLSFRPGARWS